MPKIKNLINSYKKEAMIVVIVATLSNLFALLYNYYYKYLIDSLNVHADNSAFYWLAVILFFQVAVSLCTLFVYNFYLEVFKVRISCNLKSLMFRNLFSFPFNRSSKLSAGNLMVRMSEDVSQIADYTSLYYFMLIANTLRFFITYYLLFKLDIIVACFVLCTIPFYYLLAKLSFKQMERATEKERESSDKITHSMLNKFDNLKTVKACGIENVILENLKKELDVWFLSNKKLIAWKSIFSFVRDFLSSFLPLMIVVICVYRIVHGYMSIGTLFAILNFSDAVYIPVAELMYFLSMKNNLQPIIERTNEYTQNFDFREFKKMENTNFKKTLIKKGDDISIEISNLSYSYNEDKIFKSLNMKMCGAGLYLLKGLNGKGKTTLLNILSGLITDYTGCVSICITNDKIKPVVYMIQENQIFDDLNGIENIKLFTPSTKDMNTENLEFKFPLESCNKKSNEYSGGEKRKISFLRTISKEGNIYLFDEPLENLDVSSRKIIVDAITNLAKTKMVILVSHESDCFENATIKNI